MLHFFLIFGYTNHKYSFEMEMFTLTQLYETLAQKIGRNEAEALTNYVNIKVKNELDTKTEILATKVSVKEEIHFLRNEMKKDFHGLRSEMKENIHGLRTEMKENIHGLRNEMKDNTISLQKWMLATFITLVTMIMGLYGAIFLTR